MAKVSLRAYNRDIEKMIDRGQLEEAIAHCRHILKTFPKHLETYRLLGKAYLEGKRYSDATDIFLRILAAVPNDFVAQVGMSIIRDEENKLDDAIWHMERAFETQPSNPAIQSELQRLYGRRDGVKPPRIRMTRGALAYMYVQGELYPQAISEIKSVLKDDESRFDMQVLLARACYRSGLKNEAADVASMLLRHYPYSLDANRVLAEILGADRPENAQIYRQRVFELDPYAAQVTGTLFQSNEVPEAAVSVERLDWNGQPVAMQSDWGETKAISLEGETSRDEQPDWLKDSFSESTPATPPQMKPVSIFSAPASSEPAPDQPAEEIPEFLRAAGWGAATGAFDESKPVFSEQETTDEAQPIEQGDLPDWIKAMKPVEPEPAPQGQEEELPDWITNIGKGALASQVVADQSEPVEQMEQTPPMPVADEQPDWLKSLGSEAEFIPSIEKTEESVPTEQPSQPDWLSNFMAETESPASEPASTGLGFLDQPAEVPAPQMPESAPSTVGMDNLGVSEQERDDSFAWLENLAAKQGASEGLLTKPEERLEEEPDWVKQAKGLSATQPPVTVEPPVSQPSATIEELGKSEQEQDDSFAWLENLAAKQGATEGLLTKPEERLEEEPDWVKQAKGLDAAQSSIFGESPVSQPSEIVEEPAMNEFEQDDSFAWLEDLAVKQGADESLLTKPEEHVELKPESVQEAKDLSAELPPVPISSEPEPEQAATVDETPEWLKVIDEEEAPSSHIFAADETAMWLKSLDKEESDEVLPTESSDVALPAWMKNLDEEETPVEELKIPAEEIQIEPESIPAVEETVAREEIRIEEEGIPSWLAELDKEELKQPAPADESLPAWLRAEEATPVTPEPTQPSDWKPVEEKEPEPAFTPSFEEEKQPEIIYSPPLEEMQQPETEMPVPPVPSKMPLDESLVLPEEKSIEPRQEEPKPEPKPVRKAPAKPTPAPEPHKEPVIRRGTGMLATSSIDPTLGSARNELSRSNIPGALESYGKLIKKGRYLDEVIYDLRDALYRYPVEVSIWQSLGDAYMRANRLQDALDAYTKAEELLR